jgi:hypothetical protein
MPRLTAASAVVAMTLLAHASFAQEQPSPSPDPARLQQVASFEHQVTGVTVSADGRIFVNFPRWTEDAPISVAEVTRDGQIKPYPDGAGPIRFRRDPMGPSMSPTPASRT